MRRHYKQLILIGIIIILSGLTLGFQKIKIGDFERGGDTILGLSLGLELQGGSHLVYQALDPDTKEPFVPNDASQEMDSLKKSIESDIFLFEITICPSPGPTPEPPPAVGC